ncbi:ABC transporter thiamine pyrophosphate-binding lipoprotein p37/Cypl [Mycoplasmopsis glycophila]|uniref:High affinity transport system protein p37 n=1 Tax=Mycoplasmopsis glycophila TaxID=171285 RepID=A0A449AWF5_9BACT|nr:hypothetical protein [Mycoplasmopsis glycophila]VEU71026.1 High affinity transport system protein p37 precursor [Mycoplasmopsis glycophila]
MKKKIKFLSLLSLTSLGAVTPMFFASACNNKQEEAKIIRMHLGDPYSKQDVIKANLENHFNSYLKSQDLNYKVAIEFTEDDNYATVKEKILKKEIDLGFVSAGSTYHSKEEMSISGIYPLVQTYTRKFAGEIKNAGYVDGSATDPLRVSAANEEAIFKSKPRQDWNNEGDLGMDFDGAIYRKVYDAEDALVPYQRGLFVIVATPDMTQEIVKAWNEKDLTSFVSYGLGIGSADSGSKYLLPEALMKKHFGKQFLSFKDLQAKYSEKVIKTKTKKANDQKNENIHIFMDNEGFYGYSKVESNDPYTPSAETRPGQEISFLTVTEKLPYNVALVNSKTIPTDVAKALGQAFVELQKGDNSWGATQGFNSYAVIENPEDAYWKVLKETLG